MVKRNTNSQTQTLMRINFFSKREMSELPLLLMPGERVLAVISGLYASGTAILCVTSKRILLIDKKFIRLNIEDVRFEAIKEISYSHQAVMASVRFYYSGHELQFRSWHRNELRMLSQFVQQKMFDIREGREVEPAPTETLSEHLSTVPEEKELTLAEKAPLYRSNVEIEEYLKERIARWRRASRFVDTLTLSSKTGKQILKFEATSRH